MKKEINIMNDCRGMYPQEIVETIMHSRNINDIEEFLNPSLEKYLLPLENLKNIDKAACIVLDAVKRGDLFGVYADV